MDNLLEILIPLAFAAVYFIGNMLSDKASKSARENKRERGSPGPQGEAQPSGDWEEQQRRIREEIRRKIAQRRGQSAGPEPEPTIFAGTRPEEPVVPPEREEEPEFWEEPAGTPQPAFSWESAGNAFESEMQERLRQIEETKRKAEALRKKARRSALPEDAGREAGSARPAAVLAAGPVRSQLLNTGNARAAFIYAEVFGPPVASRQPGPSLPAQQRMAG
jgi:hypothetical protein